ncbi:MAG TPA: FlgD immunoglobulin-like domain containing protein [Rubricoccaceae bacterium]
MTPSRTAAALRSGLALLTLALSAGAATAQTTVETGAGTVRVLPLGARNGVFVLDGGSGTLYAGPRLVAIRPDGQVDFPGGQDAFDPATSIDPRVFAVDARGDTVWVGLGFSDVSIDAEEPPSTAAGFAVSTDGGRTFRYRFPALDEFADTLVVYGASTLRAAPTTFPQNAPPVDIAIADGDTVYAATLLGGLRRTTNGGATWRRIVLPPDSLVVLDPGETYDFPYEPGQNARADSTFPTQGLNFAPYSVLYDEAGTLWVGTLNGLNRSFRVPGQADPGWVRYLDSPFPSSAGGAQGPVGNLVYALETRPDAAGRDAVWAACWPSGVAGATEDEEFGVVVWRGDDADGFALFEAVLLGVQVYDLAFDADRAYAASPSGLYVSADDGASWRVVTTFPAADGRLLPVNPNVGVFSVAVAATGLYVGTGDGLLRSTDGGLTWELLRASNEPGADTSGDGTGADVPDVDVYAYPNPFSPSDGALRVRFTLDGPADVTVRVFDPAMNLVRTVEAPGRPAGANEVSWDGLTDGGLRVSNGAYIYVVRAGGRQLSGRVLVFE